MHHVERELAIVDSGFLCPPASERRIGTIRRLAGEHGSLPEHDHATGAERKCQALSPTLTAYGIASGQDVKGTRSQEQKGETRGGPAQGLTGGRHNSSDPLEAVPPGCDGVGAQEAVGSRESKTARTPRPKMRRIGIHRGPVSKLYAEPARELSVCGAGRLVIHNQQEGAASADPRLDGIALG